MTFYSRQTKWVDCLFNASPHLSLFFSLSLRRPESNASIVLSTILFVLVLVKPSKSIVYSMLILMSLLFVFQFVSSSSGFERVNRPVDNPLCLRSVLTNDVSALTQKWNQGFMLSSSIFSYYLSQILSAEWSKGEAEYFFWLNKSVDCLGLVCAIKMKLLIERLE